MSTHTPGPWVASPFGDCAYEIVNEVGTAIAEVDGAHEDSARIEANANLIAAAPELLAALRSARSWVAQYAELRGHEAASASMLRVIEAAIAKAGGR